MRGSRGRVTVWSVLRQVNASGHISVLSDLIITQNDKKSAAGPFPHQIKCKIAYNWPHQLSVGGGSQ